MGGFGKGPWLFTSDNSSKSIGGATFDLEFLFFARPDDSFVAGA